MRAGGAAQTIGGAAMTLGSIALCDTGIGCVVGTITAAYGVDNAVAGARTAVSGKPAATVGEQALRELTGVSESTAAFIYGLPSMLYGSGLGNKLASGGKYTYKPIIPLNDSKATDFSHKLPDEIDSTKQLPKVGKVAGVEKQTNNVSVSTGFYNPKQIREGFEQQYGKENVLSTTVPPSNAKNVKLAGKAHPRTGVPFDNKGYPIFDKYTVFDTRLNIAKFNNLSYKEQMREATRDLANQIKTGIIPSSRFSEKQLDAIFKGKDKIPNYTWHHHQDTGRMQLLNEQIHKETGHIGYEGMKNGK